MLRYSASTLAGAIGPYLASLELRYCTGICIPYSSVAPGIITTLWPATRIAYARFYLPMVDLHGALQVISGGLMATDALVLSAWRRYESCWLPLLGMYNPVDNKAPLAAPADVALIWLAHATTPTYFKVGWLETEWCLKALSGFCLISSATLDNGFYIVLLAQ